MNRPPTAAMIMQKADSDGIIPLTFTA